MQVSLDELKELIKAKLSWEELELALRLLSLSPTAVRDEIEKLASEVA